MGVAGTDEQHDTESPDVPVDTPSWFDGATGVRFHRNFWQRGWMGCHVLAALI